MELVGDVANVLPPVGRTRECAYVAARAEIRARTGEEDAPGLQFAGVQRVQGGRALSHSGAAQRGAGSFGCHDDFQDAVDEFDGTRTLEIAHTRTVTCVLAQK